MIDFVAYVADIDDLTARVMAIRPQLIGEDGSWMVFQDGPTARSGSARLVYRRVDESDFDFISSVEGVVILGSSKYVGSNTDDAVYSQVFENSESKALYDSVYSSDPVEMETGDVVYTLDSSEPTEATVTFEVGGGTMSMRVNVDSPTELWSMAGVPIKVEPESISVSEPVPQTYTYNPPERFGSL